jgi:hypothetical protein
MLELDNLRYSFERDGLTNHSLVAMFSRFAATNLPFLLSL